MNCMFVVGTVDTIAYIHVANETVLVAASQVNGTRKTHTSGSDGL